MRVDFYQLSRDPAEAVVPLLAANTLKGGERLLVVCADAGLAGRIGEALWSHKDGFLANGAAASPHAERQPVLVSDQPLAINGAQFVIMADGQWRAEAEQFQRVFLLFDGSTIDDARATWRSLNGRDGVECHYWQQDGGKWTKAA